MNIQFTEQQMIDSLESTGKYWISDAYVENEYGETVLAGKIATNEYVMQLLVSSPFYENNKIEIVFEREFKTRLLQVLFK